MNPAQLTPAQKAPDKWTELAPAKINLALHVVGQRADGFHEIESLVCFTACADELRVSPAAKDHVEQDRPIQDGLSQDRLNIDGPFADGLAGDNANLVSRAVAAFRDTWPGTINRGLAINLTKNLPLAAGIGGGSADAAAMLRILQSLSGPEITAGAMADLALRLGADVPVCLDSAPVIMRGIGERISPVKALPPLFAVLVNPGVSSSTSAVFNALEQRHNPPLTDVPENLGSARALADWLARTRNDLEPPATGLVPAIADITSAMNAHKDCLFARLSGSGATVFGLFETASAAGQAAEQFRLTWPDYWIKETFVLAGAAR